MCSKRRPDGPGADPLGVDFRAFMITSRSSEMAAAPSGGGGGGGERLEGLWMFLFQALECVAGVRGEPRAGQNPCGAG